MKEFLAGVKYLFSGFDLITKPGLRKFVLIPIGINILLFLGLFFLFGHFVDEFNDWMLSFLPSWLEWLSVILWTLFAIGYMLFFVFTFVILANLISAPFNSLLAEKVELFLTGKKIESRSLFDNVKDTPRIIGRQFSILGYYVPRALLLLILFFIPIIQLIAAFLWFMFNAWFMVLSFIDYPTDNHRIPLKDVRAWLSSRRFTAMGLGSSILIASMIPFLNLFVIPASVAAATKFWVDR